MKITETLIQGEFVKRFKRFFAEVRVGLDVIVAHVPNTGSLKGCLYPGSLCAISESQNPARKLKATLHFLKTPTSWVGVNTSLPNHLVYEAWENGHIPTWKDFKFAKREHKISKESRLDMVLALNESQFQRGQDLHYIEIKNVTYAEGERALFPDAVTERGQKHLRDLIQLKKKGFGAEIIFTVQRHDCRSFGSANDIDPEYGRLLRQAVKAGVVVKAFACEIDPTLGVSLIPTELILDL